LPGNGPLAADLPRQPICQHGHSGRLPGVRRDEE
jgi:hypothetical protein